MVRSPGWVAAIAFGLLVSAAASGHPGSGIALDRRGNVFFIDTAAGVWRIDPQGKLERYGGQNFHWMTLDLDDRFGSTRLLHDARAEMSTTGRDPRAILSSDYPVTIGEDGALYYTEPDANWRLSLIRMAPSGERTVKVVLPKVGQNGDLRWINGIARGREGSLLFTDDRTIYRIAADGKLSTVLTVESVPQCAAPPGPENDARPNLRGLAEAPDGSLWVAAAGCKALLRIAPGGRVEVALRSDSDWSPTAVALGERGVYVEEYWHTAAEDRPAWVPRVRLLRTNGSIETLATVRREKHPGTVP